MKDTNNFTSEDIEQALLPVTADQLKVLSRKDLVELLLCEQKMRIQAFKDLEKKFEVEGKFITLKRRVYGISSEKSKLKTSSKKSKNKKKSPAKRNLKPSERYPNLDVEDWDIEFSGDVLCDCCGNTMKDSGLRETTEQLTVVPKKYFIKRYHHVTYKCSSCDSIQTASRVPRIKPGSSYSDNLIIDVAMSKFCDLVPIERYAAIAGRDGVLGLPPNSLIELTHYLAELLLPVVDMIELEIKQQKILHADETPHRMMEQVKNKSWYLWGFSSKYSAFFKCYPSRSGDIAKKFLKESLCRYFMSDAYAGYTKGVRLTNIDREEDKQIVEIFCNAHARRKFKELDENPDADFFIFCYRKIYHLESRIKDQGIDKNFARSWQKFYFAAMEKKATKLIQTNFSNSGISKACNYFLKHYAGLSAFLTELDLPLDNNSQERLLRSPVVGRKTWYGTHSLQGGKTAGVLFSIVESCKLNNINPRTYVSEIVRRIHAGEKLFTPCQGRLDFPQIFFPNSPPQKIN